MTQPAPRRRHRFPVHRFRRRPRVVPKSGLLAFAAVLVLLPGAPLIPILFLSQALNAVLLLVILPFLRALGRDPDVMGEYVLGRWGSFSTAAVVGLVGASVVALAVLTVAA